MIQPNPTQPPTKTRTTKPIIGKWHLPELLAVSVFVLLIVAAIILWIAVSAGWLDPPANTPDPIYYLPKG